MIGFGLRLALRGGREAAVRLAVTAAAVALGVGLLLVTLAAINGIDAQNARYAWLNSGVPEVTSSANASPDPVWATLTTDLYDGQSITRVDVAATGPRSPVPPGIPGLPGPGQYYVSPALGELLRSAPAAELADRYRGTRLGTIGDAALPAPNSLIIIAGHPVREMSGAPGAVQVAAIATKSPGSCARCLHGIPANGIRLTLSVISAAVLFPVLIFIGTATRLAAARREQRFAALRLVGATPRQISVVAAVEAGVAAAAGTVLGFALFFLLRGPLAGIPFTGEPFYPSDLTLGLRDMLPVALGVPLAAVIAARIALRRVRISPLGVSRRVTPRPLRAYRLIPLAAGIGELAYFVGRRPDSANGQTVAYLSGILLMMAGLMIAGPWLTMASARFMARRTGRPAALVAGRRLSDNPHAAFRAISGLVLAAFVTSTAVGVITTWVAERGGAGGNATDRRTVVADYGGDRTVDLAPGSSVPALPATLLTELRRIEGVRGVAVVHTNPIGSTVTLGGGPPVLAGLTSCAQFSRLSGLGRCAPGADVAAIPPGLSGFMPDTERRTAVWPAAPIDSARLQRLPIQGVAVGTDGSRAAIEQVRTTLTAAFPLHEPPMRLAEGADVASSRIFAGYRQLANAVILISLCVAGCSLAVSVVAGLNDRKRPFGLLRLTGVQLRTLRRIVLLESAVPLLITAALATAAGFLAAQLFVKSQLDYTLHPPGAEYYIALLAGLVGSLAVIASTLPLLTRLTDPSATRTE